MKLNYKARTKEGELQVGSIEAASREAAMNILSSHDLFILSLEQEKQGRWYDQIMAFMNRVKAKDMMVFTRQFATLLSAQVPLGEALRTLQKQTKNQILKETIFEVASDIDAGLSLSQSLEKYSNVFSPFYVNMIRSAEVTGRMEQTTGFLADYIEKEVAITSRVYNALLYPAFMIVLFVVVAAIMAIFVLPQIEPIFSQAGVPTPLFTQVIIDAGNILANWWYIVIIAIVALVGFVADYLRTEEGRVVLDEVVLRIPVVNNLLKKMYVSRFAESVSILTRGGIPIAQSLEIAGQTIGSIIYRDTLHQTAEDVRRGELLSQSLAKNEEYFPPLVSQMVAVGESTGRLDDLLEKIAAFYTREVDGVVANLVELIQPVLMLIIGILVAAMFASILVPIYNLLHTF
ncbi:type II secretion system F family protein [Patescibacteria group bacterium]|nr:type II secretion system F family protein [Patescibacteria group bacterium]